MFNIAGAKEVKDTKSSADKKVYSIIFALVFTAFATSALFDQGALLLGTIALILFIALFMLQTVLVNRGALVYIGILFITIAFAAPFYELLSLVFLTALVIVFLLFAAAFYKGRVETQNMMRIRFFRVSKVVSDPLITAIVIFFTATLMLTSGFSVSMERTEQIVKLAVAPVLTRYVDNFTPEMEVGELLFGIAENKFSTDERFALLPKSAQQQIINESADDLRLSTEEFFGIKLDLKKTVSGNIHNVIQSKIGELSPIMKLYWGIAVIALVWLSIKSVEFILYIPLAFLAFLLYELSLSLGIATLQLESRSKEVISLK